MALSIATIFPTDNRQPNKSEIALLVSRLDLFKEHGLTAGLVLQCNLPNWTKAAYPQVAQYAGSNCAQNIDDPNLFSLWNSTLRAAYTPIKDHPALNSVRLGNEVWFSPFANKTVISAYTMEKWHSWLKTRYNGNITALNDLYKTHYSTFEQVPLPMRVKEHKATPPLGFKGTPASLDLAEFNMDRGDNYLASLNSILKSINPDVITHIKFVDKKTFDSWPYGGTDRDRLDSVTDWVGADTRIMPYPVVAEKTPFRNTEQYALDWLAAGLGYTWMKTTNPGKLVVDLEVHAIRTSAATNDSIADKHMSAAFWTSHLHGLALHMIWSWSRDETGQPTDGLTGSLNTQPQVMDGYARTLDYINALGPEVRALSENSRPICVLWSRFAKIASDSSAVFAMIDMFEALSFFDLSLAFVTGQQCVKSGVPESCKVLFVPASEFAANNVVTVLKTYSQSGKMVFVGNTSADIFSKNERGVNRNKRDIDWLSKLPRVQDQRPESLRDELGKFLTEVLPERLVICEGTTTHESLWGVLCRSAVLEKKVVIALVNVLNKPVKAILKTAAGKTIVSATELYMNETLHLSSGLLLQPLDVVILETDLATLQI